MLTSLYVCILKVNVLCLELQYIVAFFLYHWSLSLIIQCIYRRSHFFSFVIEVLIVKEFLRSFDVKMQLEKLEVHYWNHRLLHQLLSTRSIHLLHDQIRSGGGESSNFPKKINWKFDYPKQLLLSNSVLTQAFGSNFLKCTFLEGERKCAYCYCGMYL